MVMTHHRALGSLIQASLKEEGIKALKCSSTHEALEKLHSTKASVVVTDPADLLWKNLRIRELMAQLVEKKIVAFTALSLEELGKLPLGFAAVVAKSSNLEPLVETIKSLQEAG